MKKNQNDCFGFDKMIRWDLVEEDLAKGKDSHLLQTLGKKEGK